MRMTRCGTDTQRLARKLAIDTASTCWPASSHYLWRRTSWHRRPQGRPSATESWLPVRRRMIPKAGGRLRSLGIPTARDRTVQASPQAGLVDDGAHVVGDCGPEEAAEERPRRLEAGNHSLGRLGEAQPHEAVAGVAGGEHQGVARHRAVSGSAMKPGVAVESGSRGRLHVAPEVLAVHHRQPWAMERCRSPDTHSRKTSRISCTGTSLNLIATFHGRCRSGGDANLSGAGSGGCSGVVPPLANRWSHAAGETHRPVVPCCWRATPGAPAEHSAAIHSPSWSGWKGRHTQCRPFAHH